MREHCRAGGDELCPHWEGFIHEVRAEQVLLMFDEEFHQNFRNEDYDVMFTLKRWAWKQM